MDLIREAFLALERCEATIRELIEKSIAARRYEDAGELAKIAARLSSLDRGRSPRLDVVEKVSAEALRVAPDAVRSALRSTANKSPKESRRKAAYPIFARQEDRLIKVGWQKKDRSEYEHRAPYEAVQAIVRKFWSSSNGGKIKIEDVLPVLLPDDNEIPSYQSYLVLGWLRDRGLVQRLGNDGYKLLKSPFGEDDLRLLFENTPERARENETI